MTNEEIKQELKFFLDKDGISINDFIVKLADCIRWNPCSERLPDGMLNESFLVQDKDGRRAVGTYTNWGWMFAHYMNDPVAWMPLPEPYTEE